MSYWVETEVVNPTDRSRSFTIPQGRMISPKDLKGRVQNLVVTQSTKVTVPARGKAIVTVPTQCTDPSYAPPSNTLMDVTTFGRRERKDNVFPGRRM